MKIIWKKAVAAVLLGAALTAAASGAAVIWGPLKEFMNCPIGEMLSGVISARADVLWEPDDPYYMKRWENEDMKDEFVLNNRNYFVNGSQGYIYVAEDPESQRVTDALENGTLVFVSFTYTDRGQEWGVIQYQRDSEGKVTPNYGYRDEGEEGQIRTGWILMEDVSLVYDSTAFMEEYAEEIETVTENPELTLKEGEELLYWTYPGSGFLYGKTSYVDNGLQTDASYTDEDGRIWGHISYYMGTRDVWICVSDPTALDLPVHAGKIEELTPPAAPPEKLPETIDGGERADGNLLLPAVLGLIILAVGSSGGIIWYLYRKKKTEESIQIEKEEKNEENDI